LGERKGYEQQPDTIRSLTIEICPNCKSEMTITEAAPVLLNDQLKTITYQ